MEFLSVMERIYRFTTFHLKPNQQIFLTFALVSELNL